jgi:Domain of unknown function (DUF5666)
MSAIGIELQRRKSSETRMIMGRFWMVVVSGIALAGPGLVGFALGLAAPSQNIVSPSTADPASHAAIQPLSDDSDTTLDPASLLPDLPSLPPAKASLVGGTVQKLDRVRDQITVQVFGGGKMKIFFDTRTHIYEGSRQASTSDLHLGDRVYVDTILDGSTVFAKTIRLKTTASAGESQGIVVSYRVDKNELVLRDVLSPRPLKIRLTPQTSIVYGDPSASKSELVPGTLVAVKFGPQQDGSDLAREVSVLAVPGASFAFAGRVTGLDLRLGLLTLTSVTDNRTYEIYFDPSVITDDNLRQANDVTVLTRFDGSRYVARSVTVNSQNQR